MRSWAVKMVWEKSKVCKSWGLSHTALLQAVRVRVGIARTFSMDSEGGTEVARKLPSKSSLMKLTKSELAKRLGQMGLQVRTIEGFVLLLACT